MSPGLPPQTRKAASGERSGGAAAPVAQASRLRKPPGRGNFGKEVSPAMDRQLSLLGRLCGIAPQYWDGRGALRQTSTAAFQALLTAMGVPWQDPELLAESVQLRRRRHWNRFLKPVELVQQEGPAPELRLNLTALRPEVPARLEGRVSLVGESGEHRSWEIDPATMRLPGRVARGRRWRLRLALPLPRDLDPGYYEMDVALRHPEGEETGACRLIVAPPRAHLPPILGGDRRLWGLGAPLYALRSRRNWGMGDFSDLCTLTSGAAELGAAFVGINPLHAPVPSPRADMSPYSPASRLFLNILYLDLEATPEWNSSSLTHRLACSPDFVASRRRLRDTRLVRYPELFRLKRRALSLCFQEFLERHGPPQAPLTDRGRDLARFVAEGGKSLERYGVYCALVEKLGRGDWRRWPETYRHPDNREVQDFAAAHGQAILLHQYGQWLASSQLSGARRAARQAGLPFSLYHDLALGAAAGGFETWAHPGLFAQDAAMGAPPDAFNPRGQNWGLPPMVPEALWESGFHLFIHTLRANCPPEGILRLDHIMGLFRLFWIPAGMEANQGTYVYYPFRELLAILTLESRRRRTLIIGEDLGTVAPRVRTEMARRDIFSYKVFYFERTPEGGCRSPRDYPRQALAAITTHDLPTLAGYWEGRDIAWKKKLNLYPQPEQAAADAALRPEERRRFTTALTQQGLLAEEEAPGLAASGSCPAAVRRGVAAYLGAGAAALLEVRLEEVFGLRAQQNLPGTIREYPNWRRKIPIFLENLTRHAAAGDLARSLARQGRSLNGEQ
ncbi:MAG: 4-alpha-glucanotransferase [Deltaproteobacteria bacterium]|nr:4-alpha-glucanotransferase [Deltaproteobacteria bacterium]